MYTTLAASAPADAPSTLARMASMAKPLTVGGMLRRRRRVLHDWRTGRISAGAAVSTLRSMSAKDGRGDTWMMRPSRHGCLFVRIDPSGRATTAPLMDHRPRWLRAAVAIGGAVVVVCAVILGWAGWVVTG